MWRLWIGLGLVALAAGLTMVFVSCQSPRKPQLSHRKGLHGKGSSEAEGSAEQGKDQDARHLAAKGDSAQIFDPDRPCLNRGQARRAQAVLFRNRVRPDPEQWIRDLNEVMFDLKTDCASDDFLLLVLTTIQMESNVHIDPPVGNANLEELYANRLKGFRQEHPLEAAALNLSGLDEQLRAKLRKDTRKAKVRTEADLDRYVLTDLRPWLLRTLQGDYHLTEGMAEGIVGRAVPDPVHTIGPMQVDVDKAYRNALKRGEKVPSVLAMKTWLLDPETALKRGLREGVYLLHLTFQNYLPRMDRDNAVLFSAADYNAGEFSSRNAAFQDRVAILTGKKLVLDGDLLLYRGGVPDEARSKTEGGTLDLLQSQMTPEQIRRDLLLEKEPGFLETRTAQAVCVMFQNRRKSPCAPAKLPVGAANPTAENKWGMTLTPANYAYGYVKRYMANRAAYEEASALNPADAPTVGALARP
jgi:hypothetical protein